LVQKGRHLLLLRIRHCQPTWVLLLVQKGRHLLLLRIRHCQPTCHVRRMLPTKRSSAIAARSGTQAGGYTHCGAAAHACGREQHDSRE
jgi:hypothetical protein